MALPLLSGDDAAGYDGTGATLLNPLPLSPAALPLAPEAANTRSSAGQLHHQSVQNTRFGSGCRPPPRRPGKRPDRRFALTVGITVSYHAR